MAQQEHSSVGSATFPPKPTPAPSHHNVVGIFAIAESIAKFLPRLTCFEFATLLRLPSIQARALISYFQKAASIAAARGDLALLDFASHHNLFSTARDPDAILDRVLCAASEAGHVHVLQWCKAHAAPAPLRCPRQAATKEYLKSWTSDGPRYEGSERNSNMWDCGSILTVYNVYPLDLASMKGHVAVLRWWQDESGADLRYTDAGVLAASRLGHIAVLEWWRDSGLLDRMEPALAEYPMDWAAEHGQLAVLQWWRDSGLPLKYSAAAMEAAPTVEVLEWWRRSGLDLTYDERAVDGATARGDIELLRWWRDSGLEIKYSHSAMDLVARTGRTKGLACLQWWKDSGLVLKYTEAAMDNASGSECLAVLQWWKESGLPLKYTNGAIGFAKKYNPSVYDWWKQSGLELNEMEIADKYQQCVRLYSFFDPGILAQE